MKITGYSIVFNGDDKESSYAAATVNNNSVWAVASGNREQAALNVIQTVEETVSGLKQAVKLADLEYCLTLLNPILKEMRAEVSLAGVIINGTNVRMFNTGNARVLWFSNGSFKMHTDDHTEAYEKDFDKKRDDRKEYDDLRFRQASLVLKRALGNQDKFLPQFYQPFDLQKDDALVICTECFWRYLNLIEMELDFRKSAGPEEWVRIMARRVMMKAGRNLDNEFFAVTAIMAE